MARYTSSLDIPNRSDAEQEGDAMAVRASSAKCSRGARVGGPKSRGVIAVAQA